MKFVTVVRIIRGDVGGVPIEFKAVMQRDRDIYGENRYLMPHAASVNGIQLSYADACTLWDATVSQDIALEEIDDEEFEQRRMMED